MSLHTLGNSLSATAGGKILAFVLLPIIADFYYQILIDEKMTAIS